MIGRTVSHFRILEKLGGGGMGVVYAAEDTNLGRRVALKFLPEDVSADRQALERLKQEAQTASALNHPNICTIYEVGEAEGQTYIAMERVEGKPLSALVGREGIPVDTALRYGLQIADALAHAHDHCVIHRDLKSANVVITPDGRAKVLDFGLARRLGDKELQEVTLSQASLTAGAVVGTVPYMAPEILRGQPADARSDLWSLGVMLYEMTAGTRPFQGQTGFELSSAILKEPPTPLSARVPAGLRAVIQRCLVKEPEQRYQRANEVRAALEALQSVAPIPAIAVLLPWRRLPWRWPLAVAGALALLLALFLVVNVGGWRERFFGRAGPPRIDSLAVLPLENLSRDPEQDYFVAGMHEALIAELSRINALKVISRTSTLRYKGTDKPMPQVARELGVKGLIEGSVIREGDTVRITVQLIHGPSDRHLWAHSFDRELHGILALQSEVARSVAEQIKVTLAPQEQARLARAPPVNPEAYQLYLQGRYFLSKPSEDDLRKASQHLEGSVAKDPNYAPAQAALAYAYDQLSFLGYDPPRVGFPKAKTAVTRALELDEALAEAHSTLSDVKLLFDWDWSGAEKEMKRALELNPSSADSHEEYSFYLMLIGRFDEATAEMRRAHELDPVGVLTAVKVGWCYVIARRYEEGIYHLKKALELDPNDPVAQMMLAFAYARKGMRAEASAEYEKTRSRMPAGKDLLLDSWLAPVYVFLGKRGEGLKLADWWSQEAARRHVDAYNLAVLYAELGVKERALDWLEKGFEQRSPSMVLLRVDPELDNLRSDPRFADLLRRMNLPQ